MNTENNIPENLDRKETVESVPYIVYESAQARNERTVKTMQEKHDNTVKKLVRIIITVIVLFFASQIAWICAWFSYDYESEIVTVESSADGDAYYNGDNGSVLYGEGSSEKAKTN
mgnify:CR=1 FL=1